MGTREGWGRHGGGLVPQLLALALGAGALPLEAAPSGSPWVPRLGPEEAAGTPAAGGPVPASPTASVRQDPPPGETPPGETPPGETPPGDEPPEETPPGGENTPPGGTPPPAPRPDPVPDTPPGDPTEPAAGRDQPAPAKGALEGVPDAGAAEGTPPEGAPPGEEAAPAGGEPAAPAPARLPPFQPAYRTGADVAQRLAAVATAVPSLARDLAIASAGGALPALEFGSPGPVPLAERPTVFLLGALDGLSLSGGEAVLACVHHLLEAPERMPPDLAFVAVPWGSPDALEATLAGEIRGGRTSRPMDDDRDGRLDEDGPDDLDGDGLVLSMLVEDPAGTFARARDGRFLVRAGPGDWPRYLFSPEGRDDDGDGRFNEDGPGGVVLDRNFPVHRTGPWDDPACGELPLSEPAARALADLVLARPAAAVLLFQSNHGALAVPGALAPAAESGLFDAADLGVLARVVETFEAATGRRQPRVLSLFEASGGPRPGAALDWLHAVPGALALEIAPWGPRVLDERAPGVAAKDARFAGSLPRSLALDGRPPVGAEGRAWASWLDNTRGGLGFVDWHPVEIGSGRVGLVGGWEPRTVHNPPPESLAQALAGLPEFAAAIAAALPRLEVRVLEASREGEVCRIRAAVKNLGSLPTGLGGGGKGRVTLALELPPGARLLAGEPSVARPRLEGRELSGEIGWVVVAPAASSFRLVASADWAPPVAREVRP